MLTSAMQKAVIKINRIFFIDLKRHVCVCSVHGNDDFSPSPSPSLLAMAMASTRSLSGGRILCTATQITPNNSRIASSARRTLIHG